MNIILIITLTILFLECHGQDLTKEERKNAVELNCNREVYGSINYIKELPSYICIPNGYIIDDFIRFSDFDLDGLNDFLAIKYNKKEEDQVNEDSTFWDFYLFDKMGGRFNLRYTLTNIVPPFVMDISNSYLAENPIAEDIFNNYPLRLPNNLALIVSKDTLKLGYKLDDTFGKQFVFIFSDFDKDWFLNEVRYFIGDLPLYWWKENDFYYPLKDQILILEKRSPNKRVSIRDFNLIDAFKYRMFEINYLAEFYMNQIDVTKFKDITNVNFKVFNQTNFPSDWPY